MGRLLREDIVHNAAVDVGESEVAAAVAVGEAGMVEAQLVQDGGVQVVYMHAVYLCDTHQPGNAVK